MNFYEYDVYIENLMPIYKDLEEKIRALIPQARVEHVGASSVKGCVSKGDLDILVAVNQDDFEHSIDLIKTLDFYEKRDTLRTHDLCMFVTDRYQEDVAIQLIVSGSSFEDFIKFRDILRSDSKVLTKYNQLKMSSKGLSQVDYRSKKNDFISSIMARKPA